MSREIVAQPGLEKIECDVIITALNFFRDALIDTAKANPDPENPANASHAVKLHQYCHVADAIIGKISRATVRLGKLPNARLITPGRTN